MPGRVWRGLVIVAMAGSCRARSTSPSTEPVEKPTEPVLELTGPSEGWPPQVKGMTDVKAVPWTEIPGSLTDARVEALKAAALQNAAVRGQLGDRYAYVDASEEAREAQTAKLVYFSHSHNAAVVVHMKGTAVASVERPAGYSPPEGTDEIQASVALAHADGRIPSSVPAENGQAMVVRPPPGSPGHGDRVLWVVFLAEGEDLPSHFALVNLTARTVLSAGPMQRWR